MGDFFMGQVVSGADYGWLQQAESNAGNLDQYCSDRQTPCWDENLSGNDEGRDSIGRVSGAGFASDNLKILTSIDTAMLQRNVSWCDRCRVFALHQPGANISEVQSPWQSCLDIGELQTVLGPGPDPANLRLSADTCQLCPDRFTSNADGQCVFCPNTVVGNECEVCTTDVVLDGNTLPFSTLSFDVNLTAAGDTCPNVLLVEVQNPAALYARGADFFSAGVEPFRMPRVHAAPARLDRRPDPEAQRAALPVNGAVSARTSPAHGPGDAEPGET